jgi:PAS domain-containing protein
LTRVSVAIPQLGGATAICFPGADRAYFSPVEPLKTSPTDVDKPEGQREWQVSYTVEPMTTFAPGNSGGGASRDHRADLATGSNDDAHCALTRSVAVGDLDCFFTLPQELMCINDTTGLFVSVNDGYRRLLGYETEDLVGRPG